MFQYLFLCRESAELNGVGDVGGAGTLEQDAARGADRHSWRFLPDFTRESDLEILATAAAAIERSPGVCRSRVGIASRCLPLMFASSSSPVRNSTGWSAKGNRWETCEVRLPCEVRSLFQIRSLCEVRSPERE